MVVQHNIEAMNACRMQSMVKGTVSTSMQKLASGYRINSASDNAAGLAISEKMRFQIRGLHRGANNIQEGIGYCQTADGALHEVHDMLQRMNELAVESANGTNSMMDRLCIDDEVQNLLCELQRVCDTTKYNDEYIFKCTDVEPDFYDPAQHVYHLKFSGYPNDLFVYNDSYDKTTGTVTYGGIAYNGKRYAWSSISPTMYDSTTGKFREGTYTLKADDGSYLTLLCENGSVPPQVSRAFTTSASEKGILINDSLISWDMVKTASGESLDPKNIKNEPYSFTYHGITVSFTPEPTDDFNEVIAKMTGTHWKSTYRVPDITTTAIYTDFSKTKATFTDRAEVEKFLNAQGSTTTVSAYTLRADEDGIWLEQNGQDVPNSKKTWVDIGITDANSQNENIWSDKIYEYIFQQTPATDLAFSFQIINNEISKDSIIDALDGASLSISKDYKYEIEDHANLTEDPAQKNANILKAQISSNLKLTLEEDYRLGMDYSTITQTPPEKPEIPEQQLVYDPTTKTFSLSYPLSGSATPTSKDYVSTQKASNTPVKNKIMANMDEYLKLIKMRHLAGASKPEILDLASLISGDKITGNGNSTYLKDVFVIDPKDPDFQNLKTTLSTPSNRTPYASASIDFSGLGTSYELFDLVGMGFNSTCQTCSNHYSVQFTTPQATNNTSWDTAISSNGYQYRYKKIQSGSNHTLYIDIESLEPMLGTVTDNTKKGVAFTNALVDILDKSGFDFHFTQYATYTDSAKLYIFDNRTQYSSGATNASFSPYSYTANTIADVKIQLNDTSNSSENISVEYEYDYKDLFDEKNLTFSYVADPNGKYIQNAATGKYEKYDPFDPTHATLQRYTLDDVSFNTNGKTKEEFVEDYIDTIFTKIADASKINLINDKAQYYIAGEAKNSPAWVTKYNTPYQILPPEKSNKQFDGLLRIQCSSNVIDSIYIPKQKLSVSRMGLAGLTVKTESHSNKAIRLVDQALTKINTIRSTFGAYQNRLEHAYLINQNTNENTQSAESIIRDTDMAEEMVNYANANILQQAGWSVLAQANLIKQEVLRLLG